MTHYFEAAKFDSKGKRVGNSITRWWLDDAKLPKRIFASQRLPERLPLDTDLSYEAKVRVFKLALPLIRSIEDYRTNLKARGYTILAEGTV